MSLHAGLQIQECGAKPTRMCGQKNLTRKAHCTAKHCKSIRVKQNAMQVVANFSYFLK